MGTLERFFFNFFFLVTQLMRKIKLPKSIVTNNDCNRDF